MWRSFTTNLLGTSTAGVLALPTGERRCFQDFRALSVCGFSESDYVASLSDLFHLLRDDQLLEFSSATGTPNPATQLLYRSVTSRTYDASGRDWTLLP